MAYKVIVIVGPTAVGKTSLSLALAQKFNAEIISGDSMQVYRGLDIGTAKATVDERKLVPHHLIDIREVNQRFTVADFVQDAKDQIKEISNRKKLPLIVGGTGFYLQALLAGYNLGGNEVKNSQDIRIKFQNFALKNGKKALWSYLNEIDRVAAAQIPVNNVRRIIRAIEVYEVTGCKFSEQFDQPDREIDALVIGLNTERNVLYERIEQRVDQMIHEGLVDEVRWLFQKGGIDFQAGKGIGYKELFPFINGTDSLANGVAEIKKNSRHYAKRQLTWFRNKMDVTWFNLFSDETEIEKIENTVLLWLKEKG
ncbi:tRNA (adenosine(37)-N6)-dimethylallyltransferase MiaA [Liquorilactobacillus sp.]|uniref:tRNA (adenosine(37)-N6)-dimethylallyltransferase MiaA n=1 Tax=Liquorilactobacillus sp. TaxID=2767923 RepID=UPI0039EC3ECD